MRVAMTDMASKVASNLFSVCAGLYLPSFNETFFTVP